MPNTEIVKEKIGCMCMFNTLTSSTLEYITQKTSLVPQEEVLIETFNCYKYFSVCQDVTL